MISIDALQAGTIFEYEGTYALKTEYRNSSGICECFIIGSGEMFWGGVSNPNELLVKPFNLENLLKENQWLYGKLNSIGEIIERGRSESQKF